MGYIKTIESYSKQWHLYLHATCTIIIIIGGTYFLYQVVELGWFFFGWVWGDFSVRNWGSSPSSQVTKFYHLGPLHTRAKSRDHEIVGAQKKVSKGCPNTPPKSCCAVTDPQVYCIVKSYLTRSPTKRYFDESLFTQVLTHDRRE